MKLYNFKINCGMFLKGMKVCRDTNFINYIEKKPLDDEPCIKIGDKYIDCIS